MFNNGVKEQEHTEAMEEEKQQPSAAMDVKVGGESARLAAAEETRLGGSQNGEAEEDEAAAPEKIGVKRRNSSVNSEASNMENRGGCTPTEEPPRKRFQIPKKSREKKGGRHLL